MAIHAEGVRVSRVGQCLARGLTDLRHPLGAVLQLEQHLALHENRRYADPLRPQWIADKLSLATVRRVRVERQEHPRGDDILHGD